MVSILRRQHSCQWRRKSAAGPRHLSRNRPYLPEPGPARKETAMRIFKSLLAVAAVAVALSFASTASAAPPPSVVKVQPTIGGGYIPGYIPGGYVPGGYIPG